MQCEVLLHAFFVRVVDVVMRSVRHYYRKGVPLTTLRQLMTQVQLVYLGTYINCICCTRLVCVLILVATVYGCYYTYILYLYSERCIPEMHNTYVSPA